MSGTPQTLSSGQEDLAQPDDPRDVRRWNAGRLFFSARRVVGWLILAIWLPGMVNEWCGRPYEIQSWVAFGFLGLTALYVLISTPLLDRAFTRTFYERRLERTDSRPRRLKRLVAKSEPKLEEAGFSSVGAFRCIGGKFECVEEVFLGPNGKVVAELIELDARTTIELVSINDQGRVLLTSSLHAFSGQRRQSATEAVCFFAGQDDLKQLLDQHLELAESVNSDSGLQLLEFKPDDVTDVMRYACRAFHNLLVEHDEAEGAVGPMTYGRFRFPTGLRCDGQ